MTTRDKEYTLKVTAEEIRRIRRKTFVVDDAPSDELIQKIRALIDQVEQEELNLPWRFDKIENIFDSTGAAIASTCCSSLATRLMVAAPELLAALDEWDIWDRNKIDTGLSKARQATEKARQKIRGEK